MLITADRMKTLPFQPFRKTSLIRARPLTEDDYWQKDGIIQTKEGPVPFQAGDYLAKGIHNEEWPIAKRCVKSDYECVSGPDPDGFYKYRALGTRLALQITSGFTVQYNNNTILNGKPGDYLVRSGDNVWITERNIFEHTYERV